MKPGAVFCATGQRHVVPGPDSNRRPRESHRQDVQGCCCLAIFAYSRELSPSMVPTTCQWLAWFSVELDWRLSTSSRIRLPLSSKAGSSFIPRQCRLPSVTTSFTPEAWDGCAGEQLAHQGPEAGFSTVAIVPGHRPPLMMVDGPAAAARRPDAKAVTPLINCTARDVP